MATLSAIQHFTMTLADGSTFEVGSKTTPQTVTLTNGTVVEIVDVIADNYGEDVLWTAGGGGLDSFEALMFYADEDVWLEFRTDLGAGAQYIVRKFSGGVWHLWTADDIASAAASVLDGAVLVDDTDYAQIDQIECHRDEADGQGDATVHLVLLA